MQQIVKVTKLQKSVQDGKYTGKYTGWLITGGTSGKGGDSTRKNKSKIQNKNFLFEALLSRKLILNFRSVRVHFIMSRFNGSHYRSLSRWILSQFKFVFAVT